MAPEDRKRPPMKRSDEMKALLESNGFTVEDGTVYDNLGKSWEFLPNGRVRLSDGSVISAHKFLQDHNCIS